MSSVSRKKLPLRDLAVIAAVALAVISPFFIFGQASGHDFEFHLASWMDVSRQWRSGVIFPHWAALANYGYGEPRFIFYPPVSWYLGAALGVLLPWKMVPGAYIFLSLVVAGVSMHRLARERMPGGGALTVACLYAANPYCLLTVYLRSDFAELLSAALFPLAVHYTLNCLPRIAEVSGAVNARTRNQVRDQIGGRAYDPVSNPISNSISGDISGQINRDAPQSKWRNFSHNVSRNVLRNMSAHNSHKDWRNVALLAVVYAAIWLTNPPAAVVTSYALAILFLACCIFARSGKPLTIGAAGLALGLGLAGFYLVPAVFEQRWVNIAQAISGGLRYDESFLFTWTLDPDHNLFNLTVSAVAVLMIALTGIAAVMTHRRLAHGASRLSAPAYRTTPENRPNRNIPDRGDKAFSRASGGVKPELMWVLLLTLAVASTAMMFRISGAVWHYAPELQFVQFPWRWLFVLAVSLAYFLGDALAGGSGVVSETIETRNPVRRHGVASRWIESGAWAVVVMVLAGTGAAEAADAWWYPEDVPVMQAAVQSGQGYEGTDEYCTRGGDQNDLPPQAPLVSLLPDDATDVASAGTVSGPGNVAVESWQPEHKVFDVDASQPAVAALHLLDYPAWQVHVNGRLQVADSDPHTAQMMIALPAGHSHVDVNFIRTADRSAGLALSAVTGVCFAGLLAVFRKGRARGNDLRDTTD